jgi:hypothetical protein
MRHVKAGDAAGFKNERPRPVTVGETYGRLEVVEELPRKASDRQRRFRCRCHVVKDGHPCGNMTIKRIGDLTRAAAYRACKECTEVYMKQVKKDWNTCRWR